MNPNNEKMDVTTQIKCPKCGGQAVEMNRDLVTKSYRCPGCGDVFSRNRSAALWNSKRSAMLKKAVYGMDDSLYHYLQENTDGSVATICQSILTGGGNEIDRMAHAFGKHIGKFVHVLEDFKETGANSESLDKLLSISEAAANKVYGDSERPSRVPGTAEQLLNTPMNPEVKDIKAKRK